MAHYALLILVNVDEEAWSKEYGTCDDTETREQIQADLTETAELMLTGTKWTGLGHVRQDDRGVFVVRTAD
jgi:hypothetical protein